MKRNITAKDQQLILQMYHAKKTVREISDASGVSRQSIYNVLSKNGISPNRTNQPLDEELVQKAIEYYTVNGYSSNAIGELLDVSPKRLTKEFKDRKVKRATINPDIRDEALKKYDEGVLTVKNIAEATNLAPATVIKIVSDRKKEDPKSFVRRPNAFRTINIGSEPAESP